MSKENNVTIESVNRSLNEYIVRENNGITIGRIYIIELLKENRYCCFRLKFYKYGEESGIYLNKALSIFLSSLFNNMDIYKVNVLIDRDAYIRTFSDLGFQLEGVITNSTIVNNVCRDELLFGIDADEFQANSRQRFLILKGQRIEVKILTPEDAEDILNYYLKNREYLKPFEPAREENFYTLQNQESNLIESYKQFLNGTNLNMGIYKNNVFIGKIRISSIVMGTFKSAIAGYSIDEDNQAKGYMKEAVNLVTDYAFKEMNLHRIEASTLPDNIKSQRVLLGCGFKKLGLNEKYLYINGKWRDHITFYKINEE